MLKRRSILIRCFLRFFLLYWLFPLYNRPIIFSYRLSVVSKKKYKIPFWRHLCTLDSWKAQSAEKHSPRTLIPLWNTGVHHLQYHVPASGPSVAEIRKEMDARQMTISALSGTYNMIDPDVERRHAGLRMLRSVAENCAPLGTSVITLCTGSSRPTKHVACTSR